MILKVQRWIKHHPLAVYLVLANGITWLCMLPELLGINVRVVSWLAVHGPLLAAIVVSYASNGSTGLRNLWNRIVKWRVGIRWYLIVLLLPLCVNVVAVGTGSLFVDISLETVSLPALPYAPFYLLALELLTSGLEEPGWRGYALPELQSRHTAQKSSWILGVLWAVWHLPIMAAGWHLGEGGMLLSLSDLTSFVMSPIGSMALNIVNILGATFVFTWIYNNTQSAFLMILFHAWVNTVNTCVACIFQHPIILIMLIALSSALAGFLSLGVLGRDLGLDAATKPPQGTVSKEV